MNSDINLLNSVTAFLNLEADLLDHKDYAQWLQLWHPSGLYIVPVDHNSTDYANNLNVAYDDHEMRQMRIERLTSGEAVSTALAQKTVRTLSRIRILDEVDGVIKARCAYCLYENNKNGIRHYPANLQFTLVPDDGSFKIMQKVVEVMKSDQYLATVSYLF